MERDFLGLSSKEEPLAKVKEEIDNDGAQGFGYFSNSILFTSMNFYELCRCLIHFISSVF